MLISVLRNWHQSFVWWRLRKKLLVIDVVVLDVDGVLTDGGLWYSSTGELIKRFDVRDGLGIRLLQSAGLEVIFLSGGKGGATEIRAKDLGIKHCIFGAKDKVFAIQDLCKKCSFVPERMLFLGDDLNDLAIRECVHLLVATGDAAEFLKKKSDATLLSLGGHGAVRELAEKLLKVRGDYLTQLSLKGWRDKND